MAKRDRDRRAESRRDLERRMGVRGASSPARVQVDVADVVAPSSPSAPWRPSAEYSTPLRKHHLQLEGRELGVLLQVPADITAVEWRSVLAFVERRVIVSEIGE